MLFKRLNAVNVVQIALRKTLYAFVSWNLYNIESKRAFLVSVSLWLGFCSKWRKQFVNKLYPSCSFYMSECNLLYCQTQWPSISLSITFVAIAQPDILKVLNWSSQQIHMWFLTTFKFSHIFYRFFSFYFFSLLLNLVMENRIQNIYYELICILF
jgi:hypothetical protein